MNKLMNTILAAAMTLTMTAPLTTQTVNATTFSDVSTSHWASPYINTAVEAGFMSGTGNNEFSPDKTMTFAEFAVVICNGAYNGTKTTLDTDTSWGDPYINTLVANGTYLSSTSYDVTSGYYNDTWRTQGISRSVVATIVARLMDSKGGFVSGSTSLLNDYDDLTNIATSKDGRAQDLADVIANGIMSGSNGSFNPNQTLTRAEASVIIAAMEKKGIIGDGVDSSTSNTTTTTTPSTSTTTGSTSSNTATTLTQEEKDAALYEYWLQTHSYTDPNASTTTTPSTTTTTTPTVTTPSTSTSTTTSTSKPSDVVLGSGQYDTSVYTVPADTNKDGWITYAEVEAILAQVEKEYPAGTPWDNSTYYKATIIIPNSSSYVNAYGCAAFALMVSDRIFGNLPMRTVDVDLTADPQSQLRPGDVCETISHWAVNIGTHPDSDLYSSSAAGNTAGIVSWRNYGEFANVLNKAATVSTNFLYTRYPA